MNLARAAGTLGLAGCSAIASQYALADDYSGWYDGINVGRSAAKIDDGRITSGLQAGGFATTSISDKDRDNGFKLYGGYQWNRYIAVEGGYFDLGKFGFTANTVPAGTLNGTIKIRGLNLDLVGTIPLGERFSAFGRVGVDSERAKDSFTGTGFVNVLNPSPSKSATGLKYGAGLQYALSQSWGLRLEAERYRIDDAVGNKGDVDLYSLGVLYRFGAKPHAAPAAPEPMPVAAAPAPPPVVVPPPPPPPPPPVRRRVSFAADSLFDFAKSTLKPEGKQALDKFASDLRGVSFDAISVTGHTDRIGGHEYNLRLSENRAESVKAYLVASGIPAGKISAVGKDGADPVTKPGECKGNKKTAKLIACLQPDRRVDVEVSGTK